MRSGWRGTLLFAGSIGFVLALVFAGALPDVNVTWDEALGDLFFGERYLAFWTSGETRFLDFASDPWEGERQPDLGLSVFRTRPWEYPPVAATLAAGTRQVFSVGLGWFDTFDGFHALNPVLVLVFVTTWIGLLRRRVGLVAATASVALLFTHPRVVAHVLANIKDFPSMVIFSLTVLAGFAAIESGRGRQVVLVGLLWGLALGTRFNALFLPVIVLLGLSGAGLPASWKGRAGRLLGALVGALTLGGVTLVAVWPWLWADPLGRIRQHVAFLAGRHATTSEASLAPVFEVLVETMPPVFLLLVAVGLVPLMRRLRRCDPLACWVLAWIVVVLGRYLPPQAVNYDGIRHFLELFPALALVAGLGVAWILELLETRVPVRRSVLAGALIALVTTPGAVATLRTHPFELAYWNILVGGTQGAWEAGKPQVGDYWASSYRTGLRWIGENAEPDAFLAVPVAEHAVRLVASERLRGDVRLLPLTTPFSPRIPPERRARLDDLARRETVYAMFIPRRDWMNGLMTDCLERLRPEAVWELEGVPILLIYRYRPEDVGAQP